MALRSLQEIHPCVIHLTQLRLIFGDGPDLYGTLQRLLGLWDDQETTMSIPIVYVTKMFTLLPSIQMRINIISLGWPKRYKTINVTSLYELIILWYQSTTH